MGAFKGVQYQMGIWNGMQQVTPSFQGVWRNFAEAVQAPKGDWADAIAATPAVAPIEDPANAGIRREPELPEHEEIAPEPRKAINEFEPIEEDDDEPQRRRMMQRTMGAVARQISLDTGDDMQM